MFQLVTESHLNFIGMTNDGKFLASSCGEKNEGAAFMAYARISFAGVGFVEPIVHLPFSKVPVTVALDLKNMNFPGP